MSTCKSLSKINLFAEKYIPYNTIYTKFKICQTKLCMNTLYSNIQISKGIKPLNSVPWLPLRKGKEGWVRKVYTIFFWNVLFMKIYI